MRDSDYGAFQEVQAKPVVIPDTKVTVKSGDTLSAIAKANDVSLKELLAANPKLTTDPKYQGGNMIWSGTKVTIPGTGYTIQPPAAPKTPTGPTGPTTSTNNSTQTNTQTDTSTRNVDSTPNYYYPSSSNATPPVKSATPDLIQFNDAVLLNDAFADILFEQVGGQELLSIARHDTVNGQEVSYQPIKNLGILQNDFNPNNIIKLQKTSDTYFRNFTINLFDKIPKVGNGADGSNIYLDSSGNLVIEFVNLIDGEDIDVEISEDGTIYEADI
jgi:LysM repeat protein